jgi:hypothetical protein
MVLGRIPLAALYWPVDKVGGPESKTVTTGKPISSDYNMKGLFELP